MRHRPADDPAAEGIQHDGEIEKARQGRHVADVGDPQPIRPRGGEASLDQIRRRPGRRLAHRGARPPATADAGETGAAHQPGDPLAPDRNALGLELGMDARDAVGALRDGVDGSDPPQQCPLGDSARRGRAAPPGVVSGRGDAEHPTHRSNRIHGLVRLYELEEPDGITPVSLANQAAAFERISRSWRSRRFSRRRR